MSDNHPAKIAKYLLKGWCLLNEYCPIGNNTPLVKSREGILVCVCGDSACPYFPPEGEQTSKVAARPPPQAQGVQAALPVPTSPGIPDSPYQGTPVQTAAPVAPSSALPAVPVAPSSALPGTSPTSSSLGISSAVSAVPTSAELEVVLTGPDCRFSCVRLETQLTAASLQRAKLIGDTFIVAVRFALIQKAGEGAAISLFKTTLQDAIKTECDRLLDKILLPENSKFLEISPVAGQMMVTGYQEGEKFLFPQCDTVLVPVSATTMQELAGWLCQRILGGNEGKFSQSEGARWLQVSMTDGSGMTVAVRKYF